MRGNILDVDQVTEMFHIDLHVVEQLAEQGIVPAFRGRHNQWMFRQEVLLSHAKEISEYIRTQQHQAE